MSIVDLTRGRVERNTPRSREPVLTAEASDPAAPAKRSLTDALSAVAAYVPTEIIAAYTLALGATVSDKPASGERSNGVAAHLSLHWFIVFAALTPVFVWLVYAARSSETKVAFGSPRLWPWWEAIAALIAFVAWSAALPKSAFSQWDWYDQGGAAVSLAVVSLVLPLVGTVVNRQKQQGSGG